jgi:uncharacterized protein YbjT (DUF2867 family)
MKIFLTGANGYIGKRLLTALVDLNYEVICGIRDLKRFHCPESIKSKIKVIEIDLLDEHSLKKIPVNIDGAFYLVHSMANDSNYNLLEQECAINFRNAIENTKIKHVVYLSGIVNETKLSKHLASRKNVENELSTGNYNFTSLRAGIIIGSGSASFEIIRDLVEKLPFMLAPKWLNTKCQPIAVADVISFLKLTMLNEKTYNQNYDIGGPDILSYKNMLLEYAKIRKLYRKIVIVPVMTPRLSSYWLYFVTSTSYKLAIALVNSMKIEVICRNNDLNTILKIKPISYSESLNSAFRRIENNEIFSSWKDAYISSGLNSKVSDFINVPEFGCFKDIRESHFDDRMVCLNKIWAIGGKNGWYYTNFLWRFRGFIDKIFGGVGLRRGRTSKFTLNPGDTLDFWRVLYADKEEGRLLLYAEMKLPGEAWLEFKVSSDKLSQIATFRPLGLTGRLYWFLVYPFHELIFRGLIKKLTKSK